MNEQLHLNAEGFDLIKHYETLHDGDLTRIGLQPKLCPAGVVTWGYGHTETYQGKPIKSFELAHKLFPEMDDMTEEEADLLLKQDAIPEEEKVYENIKVTLLQYQFNSAVSYFYNIGYSATFVQLVNALASPEEIYAWFIKHYITANGVFYRGLLYRRQTEGLYFNTGELKFFNVP